MKIKKIHWFWLLSVMITLASVVFGATVFYKSYVRLWETLGELWESMRYYVCEIFQIKHSINVGVIDKSDVLGWTPMLPETPQSFDVRTGLFRRVFFTGMNVSLYGNKLGLSLGNIAKYITLFLPFILLAVFWIKRMYATPNNNYNKDTKPLKVFKWLSGNTYQPIKRFAQEFISHVKGTKWVTAWVTIWALNFNLVSIFVAFLAFYLYFAVSFDVLSLYRQVCNLLLDMGLVLRHFPWFLTGWIVWKIFSWYREKIGLEILRYYEARDCGFIKELPIVTMTCGSMGMKKTTLTTDMALSQAKMFRQEALERLQKQDMKFAFFPWIELELDIRARMESREIFNLASIQKWMQEKRKRYEETEDVMEIYGYDKCRYGFYFDDGLKTEDLFDVMETYAKLYFIYVIESSLIVSNYAIREEDTFASEGNFPMWVIDFLAEPRYENTRFSKILDFDVLRLGKKVIENSYLAGSFEFGVVVITEIGKERANMLELKEIKKNVEEANQKNDLFNSWLKMCRHSATVDNFPFIKVFVDEQRPESWGSDARDLANILTIVDSGKQKLVLPFYTIEEMLCEKALNWFIPMYYNFRFTRGDNTLFIYLLKCVICKIWAHNERIYNRFGYSVLRIEKERGTQEGKSEKKKYFLVNYKGYRQRFTTDCFSDYFIEQALLSGVGLMDYMAYAGVRARVEELKLQNSYFIRDLYGK